MGCVSSKTRRSIFIQNNPNNPQKYFNTQPNQGQKAIINNNIQVKSKKLICKKNHSAYQIQLISSCWNCSRVNISEIGLRCTECGISQCYSKCLPFTHQQICDKNLEIKDISPLQKTQPMVKQNKKNNKEEEGFAIDSNELGKSMVTQVTKFFKFSNQLKHQKYLQIIDASTIKNVNYQKIENKKPLALMKPQIKKNSKPLKFIFKIKKFNSSYQTFQIAVGFCYIKQATINFQFNRNIQAYMINNKGFCYHAYDKNIQNQNVSIVKNYNTPNKQGDKFTFKEGSEIRCFLDTENMKITFRNDKQQFIEMPYKNVQKDQLAPCVLIDQPYAQVEVNALVQQESKGPDDIKNAKFVNKKEPIVKCIQCGVSQDLMINCKFCNYTKCFKCEPIQNHSQICFQGESNVNHHQKMKICCRCGKQKVMGKYCTKCHYNLCNICCKKGNGFMGFGKSDKF